MARLLACSLKVKAERDKADARPVIGPRSPSDKINVGMGDSNRHFRSAAFAPRSRRRRGRRLQESLPPYMHRDAYDIGFKAQGSRYRASSSQFKS